MSAPPSSRRSFGILNGGRLLKRALSWPPLVIALFGTALPGFSQSFLAEWTAATSGGVSPTGMALAVEGGATFVYVSDHPRGRILKVDASTGAVVAVLGGPGSGNGQFNQPYGIAIEPTSGDLYIAERGNNRVQRITRTGAFVMAWGTAGAAQGQFNEPIGVAIDAAGDVYVTEHTNHRVQKFRITQTAGTWSAANLATWGTQGSGNGQFNMPYEISADATGNIWVADGFNGRVQRFNTSGVYQATLGSAGTAPGQFVVVTGVTADPSGAVYVTSTNSDPTNTAAVDANSQWVSKFSSTGTFLSRWGGVNGTGPGQFRLPFSAVVTANRAYVADFGNNRVQVFDLAGSPAGSNDMTAPTVNITVGSSTASSVTFNVAFSENVTGGAAPSFTATGAGGATGLLIASVTPDATTPTTSYTVVVNYTGTAGTVTLATNATANTALKDASNNFFAGGATTGGATSRTHTIVSGGGGDTTRPSIASFELDPASVTPASARMVVTFSEPVTGVDQSDFEVKGTLTSAATITGVTPGATAAGYHVAFNYAGTSGSLQMAIKTTGTGIVDTASNAFAGGGVAASAAYPVNSAPPGDMTLPAVSSFAPPAGALSSPVNLALVFSEPVTGVSADDFFVSPGATIGAVTGSGTTWTVPVSFTGAAPVTVMLVGGATSNIRDAATHWFAGGTAGATVTFTPGSSGGGAPVITSPLAASVTAGAPFSYAIAATNSPTLFTATGIPAGLTFTPPTITGSIATAGVYNIPIGAANPLGSDSKTLVLTVNPPGGDGGVTRTVSVAPPPNGTYPAGQSLAFTVTFSGAVTVRFGDDDDDDDNDGEDRKNGKGRSGKNAAKPGDDDDDDDDDDGRPYFTWTAVGALGQKAATGRLVYASGSGTPVLTFTYKVEKDDTAPSGITLGTAVQLPQGATISNGNGTALGAGALTLPWSANPLTGVILNGGVSSGGKGSGPVIVIKRGDGILAGQPFTLPATTASGQPITWILVSGNATLNGNVLTPKNRGAVVVRAVVSDGASSQSSVIGDFEIEDEDEARASKNRGQSPHRDRLSNLSSRLRVSSTDANRSAIAGFVVTGTSSKQVLVRAIGPGLAAFGVSDALPGARLELHDQFGGVIAENDGWKGDAAISAAEERIGAFKLASGSRDSALLVTLKPGAYTAQIGATGSGIALLEVYDATGAAVLSTEQLINISTRGYVDSGDGNLIAGFVVTGDAPKRVLVRGIGAALAGFGVGGVLADPVLELYTAGGAAVVARNDNWETPQQVSAAAATTAAEILVATRATGAFPLASGSRDAAILITLMPGSYSAVMSGTNRTTGAGLVEVYEVPNP